jgi:hypothetical protein
MIKNATWNETGDTIRVELNDGTVMWVPDDMANRHRVELEEWTKVKETNVIQPYVPPAETKIE